MPTFQHPRFATPHAIDDIGGFRVDRDHAQYQYALLCVTRLAEKYMSNMFPDVHASLVEFGDRQVDYLTVTSELYNALSFPERPLKNNEVDATADCLAKEAISELARMYVSMLREEEHDVEETQPPDVAPPLPQQRKDVQDQAEFEMFYEDTLKMIVTDIEKKNVWQEETYFGNQASSLTLNRCFEAFSIYPQLSL
ncbi:hypothetical protein LSAT2_019114 [Lamellibrachia satsuma]|nr:hypothetical protein LSAT2_019114 [Lamellibrachia satsuma]